MSPLVTVWLHWSLNSQPSSINWQFQIEAPKLYRDMGIMINSSKRVEMIRSLHHPTAIQWVFNWCQLSCLNLWKAARQPLYLPLSTIVIHMFNWVSTTTIGIHNYNIMPPCYYWFTAPRTVVSISSAINYHQCIEWCMNYWSHNYPVINKWTAKQSSWADLFNNDIATPTVE